MSDTPNPSSRLDELIELKAAIERLLEKADELSLSRAGIGLSDAINHIDIEIQALKGLQ